MNEIRNFMLPPFADSVPSARKSVTDCQWLPKAKHGIETGRIHCNA